MHIYAELQNSAGKLRDSALSTVVLAKQLVTIIDLLPLKRSSIILQQEHATHASYPKCSSATRANLWQKWLMPTNCHLIPQLLLLLVFR